MYHFSPSSDAREAYVLFFALQSIVNIRLIVLSLYTSGYVICEAAVLFRCGEFNHRNVIRDSVGFSPRS